MSKKYIIIYYKGQRMGSVERTKPNMEYLELQKWVYTTKEEFGNLIIDVIGEKGNPPCLKSDKL